MPKTTKTSTIEAPVQDLEIVEDSPAKNGEPLIQVARRATNIKGFEKFTDDSLVHAVYEANKRVTCHTQEAVAWALYCGALLTHAKQTLLIPNWKDWLRSKFPELSYDTLNRYRKLYESLSSDERITSDELIGLPQAPEDQREKTLRKVEKVTGGKGIRQLYFDFDIVKKPDPKGGKREGAGRPKYDEAEYAAARRAWWHEKILKPLQVESRKPTWPYCTQADREALYDLFTELANQLKSTLS